MTARARRVRATMARMRIRWAVCYTDAKGSEFWMRK
jgi:hypothetical protein